MWIALRWATATAFGMSFSIVAVLGIDALVGPLDARALGLATLMVTFITVIVTQRFLASLDERHHRQVGNDPVTLEATAPFTSVRANVDQRV